MKLLFLRKNSKNMILSFTFTNHRSFRDRTVFSMEATASQAKSENIAMVNSPEGMHRLLKATLIYGANASGKTNILRALSSLSNEVRGNSLTVGGDNLGPMYTPFCLDDTSCKKPASMDISFVTKDMRYDYHVQYNREVILEENLYYYPNGANKSSLFSRDVDYGEQMHGPHYPTTRPKGDMRPRFGVFKNKLLLSKFFIDTPHDIITPAAQYIANIGFANNYSSNMKSILWRESKNLLYEADYKRKLTRLLQYADLGIHDFKLPVNEQYEKVFLMHNVNQEGVFPKISIAEESLGTQYLFLLGPKILFSLEKGTPLFVDEIESGLHPRLTDFVIKMYQSEQINPLNSQIIIVTHDVSLMNEDRLRRDQIWFAEKGVDGVSDLFSLSDFEGVREDTPFAKWYLANKFGALPDIKQVESLFDA